MRKASLLERLTLGTIGCVVGAILAVVFGGLEIYCILSDRMIKPEHNHRWYWSWKEFLGALELFGFSLCAIFYFTYRERLTDYMDSQRHIPIHSLWSVPCHIGACWD